MRVLVLYASKLGGTEGIAQQMGEAFVERGIAVKVAAVVDTQSLAGYDALVIGSGLYAARWRRPSAPVRAPSRRGVAGHARLVLQ